MSSSPAASLAVLSCLSCLTVAVAHLVPPPVQLGPRPVLPRRPAGVDEILASPPSVDALREPIGGAYHYATTEDGLEGDGEIFETIDAPAREVGVVGPRTVDLSTRSWSISTAGPAHRARPAYPLVAVLLPSAPASVPRH